jgi:YesN/AraC family two-component response regulator
MTVSPATVLVVEDNDEMRAFLRRQLADHYRVIEAADGEEGWRQVQEKQPDLLLSDAEMPGTDGWALGRRVKEASHLPSIPVILLKGAPVPDDEAAGSGAETAPGAVESEGATSGTDETDSEASAEGRPPTAPSKPEVEAVLKKPFALNELQNHLERYLPTRELPHYVDEASDFLKEVVQIVERRLHDPDFTAGALAKEMSLSRRHLTRRLKATADTTPAALIRERRIERAKAHFESGDTKVVDVCRTVGFRSASHFSQSFREYEGCSPTTYIEQNASS